MKVTFEEAAQRFNFRICRGIDPRTGMYCSTGDPTHTRGYAEPGIVHWKDRRMSHAALRRFLILGYLTGSHLESGWVRTFLSNRWAVWAAGQLGCRLPTHLSATDRARVKAQLVNVPTDAVLRKEAMRWSTR